MVRTNPTSSAVRLLPSSLRIAILLGCVVVSANAQDPKTVRLYLSDVLEPASKRNAAYYLQPEGRDGELFIGKIYSLDGKLKAEGRFKDEGLTIEEGPFVFYHANGKVESKGDYVMGNKSGVWLRYDAGGQAMAEKVYNPEPLANILYTRAETMPTLEGGQKALVRSIKEKVTDPSGKDIKGQVMASFIVEKNGELTDVKVIEGTNPPVDEQVVDMIKSTSPWQPGAEKGIPVRVQMRIPVQF